MQTALDVSVPFGFSDILESKVGPQDGLQSGNHLAISPEYNFMIYSTSNSINMIRLDSACVYPEGSEDVPDEKLIGHVKLEMPPSTIRMCETEPFRVLVLLSDKKTLLLCDTREVATGNTNFAHRKVFEEEILDCCWATDSPNLFALLTESQLYIMDCNSFKSIVSRQCESNFVSWIDSWVATCNKKGVLDFYSFETDTLSSFVLSQKVPLEDDIECEIVGMKFITINDLVVAVKNSDAMEITHCFCYFNEEATDLQWVSAIPSNASSSLDGVEVTPYWDFYLQEGIVACASNVTDGVEFMQLHGSEVDRVCDRWKIICLEGDFRISEEGIIGVCWDVMQRPGAPSYPLIHTFGTYGLGSRCFISVDEEQELPEYTDLIIPTILPLPHHHHQTQQQSQSPNQTPAEHEDEEEEEEEKEETSVSSHSSQGNKTLLQQDLKLEDDIKSDGTASIVHSDDEEFGKDGFDEDIEMIKTIRQKTSELTTTAIAVPRETPISIAPPELSSASITTAKSSGNEHEEAKELPGSSNSGQGDNKKMAQQDIKQDEDAKSDGTEPIVHDDEQEFGEGRLGAVDDEGIEMLTSFRQKYSDAITKAVEPAYAEGNTPTSTPPFTSTTSTPLSSSIAAKSAGLGGFATKLVPVQTDKPATQDPTNKPKLTGFAGAGSLWNTSNTSFSKTQGADKPTLGFSTTGGFGGFGLKKDPVEPKTDSTTPTTNISAIQASTTEPTEAQREGNKQAAAKDALLFGEAPVPTEKTTTEPSEDRDVESLKGEPKEKKDSKETSPREKPEIKPLPLGDPNKRSTSGLGSTTDNKFGFPSNKPPTISSPATTATGATPKTSGFGLGAAPQSTSASLFGFPKTDAEKKEQAEKDALISGAPVGAGDVDAKKVQAAHEAAIFGAPPGVDVDLQKKAQAEKDAALFGAPPGAEDVNAKRNGQAEKKAAIFGAPPGSKPSFTSADTTPATPTTLNAGSTTKPELSYSFSKAALKHEEELGEWDDDTRSEDEEDSGSDDLISDEEESPRPGIGFGAPQAKKPLVVPTGFGALPGKTSTPASFSNASQSPITSLAPQTTKPQIITAPAPSTPSISKGLPTVGVQTQHVASTPTSTSTASSASNVNIILSPIQPKVAKIPASAQSEKLLKRLEVTAAQLNQLNQLSFALQTKARDIQSGSTLSPSYKLFMGQPEVENKCKNLDAQLSQVGAILTKLSSDLKSSQTMVDHLPIYEQMTHLDALLDPNNEDILEAEMAIRFEEIWRKSELLDKQVAETLAKSKDMVSRRGSGGSNLNSLPPSTSFADSTAPHLQQLRSVSSSSTTGSSVIISTPSGVTSSSSTSKVSKNRFASPASKSSRHSIAALNELEISSVSPNLQSNEVPIQGISASLSAASLDSHVLNRPNRPTTTEIARIIYNRGKQIREMQSKLKQLKKMARKHQRQISSSFPQQSISPSSSAAHISSSNPLSSSSSSHLHTKDASADKLSQDVLNPQQSSPQRIHLSSSNIHIQSSSSLDLSDWNPKMIRILGQNPRWVELSHPLWENTGKPLKSDISSPAHSSITPVLTSSANAAASMSGVTSKSTSGAAIPASFVTTGSKISTPSSTPSSSTHSSMSSNSSSSSSFGIPATTSGSKPPTTGTAASKTLYATPGNSKDSKTTPVMPEEFGLPSYKKQALASMPSSFGKASSKPSADAVTDPSLSFGRVSIASPKVDQPRTSEAGPPPAPNSPPLVPTAAKEKPPAMDLKTPVAAQTQQPAKIAPVASEIPAKPTLQGSSKGFTTAPPQSMPTTTSTTAAPTATARPTSEALPKPTFVNPAAAKPQSVPTTTHVQSSGEATTAATKTEVEASKAKPDAAPASTTVASKPPVTKPTFAVPSFKPTAPGEAKISPATTNQPKQPENVSNTNQTVSPVVAGPGAPKLQAPNQQQQTQQSVSQENQPTTQKIVPTFSTPFLGNKPAAMGFAKPTQQQAQQPTQASQGFTSQSTGQQQQQQPPSQAAGIGVNKQPQQTPGFGNQPPQQPQQQQPHPGFSSANQSQQNQQQSGTSGFGNQQQAPKGFGTQNQTSGVGFGNQGQQKTQNTGFSQQKPQESSAATGFNPKKGFSNTPQQQATPGFPSQSSQQQQSSGFAPNGGGSWASRAQAPSGSNAPSDQQGQQQQQGQSSSSKFSSFGTGFSAAGGSGWSQGGFSTTFANQQAGSGFGQKSTLGGGNTTSFNASPNQSSQFSTTVFKSPGGGFSGNAQSDQAAFGGSGFGQQQNQMGGSFTTARR